MKAVRFFKSSDLKKFQTIFLPCRFAEYCSKILRILREQTYKQDKKELPRDNSKFGK